MKKQENMCKYCKELSENLEAYESHFSMDKPKCAFDDKGNFTSDNWNCATMNKLRNMVEDINFYSNDSYAALIPINYEGTDNDDFIYADFILLNWYKSRGRTNLAKIITSDNKIKELTLDIAYYIIGGLND